MINLNEAQSRRLDNLLKKLYEAESLDEEFLTNFFNQDKRLAYSYLNVLSDKGLVTVIESEDEILPAFIVIKDETAPLFIESGGFLALYRETAQQQRIRDLEEKVKLTELIKFSSNVIIFVAGIGIGKYWNEYWPLIKTWWPW